jgi:DNA modification methylase
MSWKIMAGDVREVLATLPDQSVQCCVTSPPYWGLRDYGVGGQIGLESSPDAYVAEMVRVFAEVRRVLRDDGVLWLNLGDSYWGGGNYRGSDASLNSKQGTNRGAHGMAAIGRNSKPVTLNFSGGAKPKDLVGIPWRVAFALQADGWYLRSDIIWHKPNPMPESVTDRPTKSHEYVFLLTKHERYFYDAEAIAEPASDAMAVQLAQGYEGTGTKDYESACVQNPSSVKARIIANARARVQLRKGANADRNDGGASDIAPRGLGRNARSVWTITTQPYPEAHFATFPEALPERCIKAGSRVGDTVLDPFCGAATTGLVADRLNRDFIGIELNPAYVELGRARIGSVTPLFPNEASGEIAS